MEWIKRFFKDERGDAYITSIVVCCAVIAILLASVYTVFFSTGISDTFTNLTNSFKGWVTDLPTPTAPADAG